mgnify:FL=1|jgi:hypothetical protein
MTHQRLRKEIYQEFFQTSACPECKSQREGKLSGMVDFSHFLRYVLSKEVSCCEYACRFIQRLINAPLYSTHWNAYNLWPYPNYHACCSIPIAVDVLFLCGIEFTSPVLVRNQNDGVIHVVFHGHLRDRRFMRI